MRQCRICNSTRVKNYIALNPVKEREWYKNDRYKRKGITKEQFEFVLDQQGGVCGICGNESDDFVADHDHSCCPTQRACGKCFRGVLCQDCNRGIGSLMDSVDILNNAIKYLNKVS